MTVLRQNVSSGWIGRTDGMQTTNSKSTISLCQATRQMMALTLSLLLILRAAQLDLCAQASAGHGATASHGASAGHGATASHGASAGHGAPASHGAPAGHGAPAKNAASASRAGAPSRGGSIRREGKKGAGQSETPDHTPQPDDKTRNEIRTPIGCLAGAAKPKLPPISSGGEP
jgi:hypothetical protein